MIKTKYFVTHNMNEYGVIEPLDEQINNFIERKNITNVIDVKFAQAISGDEECTTYLPTALLIYKEGE